MRGAPRVLIASAVVVSIATVGGCVLMLGEFETTNSSGGDGASGGSGRETPRCTSSEECAAPTDHCVNGYCREPCLFKSDCTYFFSACYGRYCSEHIGAGCSENADCGGFECRFTDSRDDPVDGYCTSNCSSTAVCPAEYECIGGTCAVIGAGGPLCYVVKDADCSLCAASNCDNALWNCCGYDAPCGTVQSAIDACDQARTFDACNDLYSPNDYDDPSSNLLTCITAHCDGPCFNPCPGEAC